MAWSAKAKALRFGERWNAITFRQGHWWHVDVTGALVGPISRKEAYLTAVSYMNARELVTYDAHEARAELEAAYAQDAGTKQASDAQRTEEG